jgi:dephospho-CoA kinase
MPMLFMEYKNMLIGLTGTYCAGKNYISALLEARGLPVLDVDKTGYQALEMEKKAVYAHFASDLQKIDASWHPDAALDRRLLGKVVFNNPKKLAELEAIVHPLANRLVNEWVAAQKCSCVINAALLHHSELFSRLDRIILVTAPLLTRLIRAKRRDKLPWKEIFKRFISQKKFSSQYLHANAEIYRIENPGLPCRLSLLCKHGSVSSQNIKLEHKIDNFMGGIK